MFYFVVSTIFGTFEKNIFKVWNMMFFINLMVMLVESSVYERFVKGDEKALNCCMINICNIGSLRRMFLREENVCVTSCMRVLSRRGRKGNSLPRSR